MPSSELSEKERLLPILWNEFLGKLDAEWQGKYLEYGTSRNQLKQKTKFARAVAEDMATAIKKQAPRSQLKLISPPTLQQYFTANGWPAKVQPNTLLVFLRYLGYKNWQAFANAHPNQLLKDPDQTEEDGPPRRDGQSWLFFGPVVLLALYFGAS